MGTKGSHHYMRLTSLGNKHILNKASSPQNSIRRSSCRIHFCAAYFLRTLPRAEIRIGVFGVGGCWGLENNHTILACCTAKRFCAPALLGQKNLPKEAIQNKKQFLFFAKSRFPEKENSGNFYSVLRGLNESPISY